VLLTSELADDQVVLVVAGDCDDDVGRPRDAGTVEHVDLRRVAQLHLVLELVLEPFVAVSALLDQRHLVAVAVAQQAPGEVGTDLAATCAMTRFVLSPFVATTTASASSIPASRSTSASMPWPSTKPPRQFSPSLVSASSFSSTAVTSHPSSASWSATFEPTRPQPMTSAFMRSD